LASGAPTQQDRSISLSSSTATGSYSSTPSHLLKAGWEAYQKNDLLRATAAYLEAARIVSEDASIWYDLGCLYALQNKQEEARRALHRALQLNPRMAAAHEVLGQLEEQSGFFESAFALYTTADTIEPFKPSVLQHLSRIFLRLNQEKAAQQALQQLVGLVPDDVEARYQLGLLKLRLGEPDLALHEFREVVDRKKDHILAWNGICIANLRIGALEEANLAIQKALQLNPQSAQTQTNVGLVAAAQEKWDEARQAWSQALVLNPGFEPAQTNLKVLDEMNPPSNP
ncbi:MAG: tetratricopeptide repeat protein, partial [Candidatus Omnitrophica bacterium]|nr:tetratricopeptide repeat protein [Candidatus Omnitrophota bacterium]